MPSGTTVYLPMGTIWYRCAVEPGPGDLAAPALLGRVVEDLQAVPATPAAAAPPAGVAAPDPNFTTCQVLTPAELVQALGSSGWTPAGPLIFGPHAALFADFCRATARWLIIEGVPDAVARMRAGQVPVKGRLGAGSAITAADLDACRAALAQAIPALFAHAGEGSQYTADTPKLGVVARSGRSSVRGATAARASAVARAASADKVKGARKDLWTWLKSWASPTGVRAVPALVSTAAKSIGDRIQPRTGTAPPVSTLSSNELAQVESWLAFAATSIDAARARAGLVTPWVSLTFTGSDGVPYAVEVPLPRDTNPEGERTAPYRVQALFPSAADRSSGAKRAMFALNMALRDQLLTGAPSGTAPTGRMSGSAATASQKADEDWLAQQLVPELTPLAKPSGGFTHGVVAFTPYGELWLLPDAASGKRFLQASKARHDAIPNASVDVGTIVASNNGTTWAAVLTEAQLQSRHKEVFEPGGAPKRWAEDGKGGWTKTGDPGTGRKTTVEIGLKAEEITRIVAQCASTGETTYNGLGGSRSVVPDKAVPYLTDSRVRAIAYDLAVRGETMDWIGTASLIKYAFKGTPSKVLLPAGTVIYKFNDAPSLVWRPGAAAGATLDTSAATVWAYIAAFARTSPWWSPLAPFERGGGWDQRVDLSKAVGNLTKAGQDMDRLRRVIQVAGTSQADLEATKRSLTELGPLLEMARSTSVVKENWNSLRYVCAIEIVQPVYAFFGDFGSLPRIDIKPDDPNASDWPDSGTAFATKKAKLTVSKAGGLAGGQVERSVTTLAYNVGQQRTAIGKQVELPGGSTQFYLPGLRFHHPRHAPDGNYRMYSFDEPRWAPLTVAGEYPAYTADPAFDAPPPYKMLDLARRLGGTP